MHDSIPMKVTPKRAETLLRGIPNKACVAAMSNRWIVDAQGRAKVRSFLWLFCWAKTGRGSPNAATESQNAFDEIFGVTYKHCESRIPHEWARQNRSRDRCTRAQLVAYIGTI